LLDDCFKENFPYNQQSYFQGFSWELSSQYNEKNYAEKATSRLNCHSKSGMKRRKKINIQYEGKYNCNLIKENGTFFPTFSTREKSLKL
jgi:hypothetical protein